MRNSAPSPAVEESAQPRPHDGRRRLLAAAALLPLAGGAWALDGSEAVPPWVARQRRLPSTGAGWGRGLQGGAPAPAKPKPLLPDAVRARLQGSGLPLDSFGLYAAPVDVNAAPVLAWQAEQPFVLASTAKVVTSMAALDLLGPRYRWRTRAYLLGPLQDGVLQGDLLIVGGGDVQLSAEALRSWFDEMRVQGLREVRGNIRIDRGAFHLSEPDYASTPIPAPDRPHHQRPDAFNLDGGVLRVGVYASRSGQAQVSISPPLAGVRLVNSVSMGGGCSASAAWRSPKDKAGAELLINGSWSPGCGSRQIEFAPLSADELSLRAVGALWREAGGRLRGSVMDQSIEPRLANSPRSPSDSSGRPLSAWLVHGSPPLTDLLREMNKTSNNVAARHLMLSLSPGFPTRPATLAGAQARLREWLQRQGLGWGDVTLDNGSGLSRAERAKPSAMVQLLRRAWRSPNASTLIESLPIAGVDGTLAHRLQQSPVQGQAHLKTGTLLDTRALAGYVHAQSGRWYAVAALANHPAAALATPALDGVIDWLVRKG